MNSNSVHGTVIVIIIASLPCHRLTSPCCIPVKSSGMAHSACQYETPAGETATLKNTQSNCLAIKGPWSDLLSDPPNISCV